MATRALLIVKNSHGIFNVSFSHDGNPAFILEVIASLKKGVEEITREDIKNAYLSKHGKAKKLVKCDFSLIMDHSWEYHIDQQGQLTVYCFTPFQSSDPDLPVNPMIYLNVIREECKIKVAKQIKNALHNLSLVEINCAEASGLVSYPSRFQNI